MAWLNPNPADPGARYAIFDDKRHPFYEHHLAAQLYEGVLRPIN